MNILYICDEYPPGQHGGIGTMVQVLSRELIRQGHKVVVIGLYPHYYNGEDYEIDQGVEVFRLRYGYKLSNIANNFLHKLINRLPNFVKARLYGNRDLIKFFNFINDTILEKKIDLIEIPDWNTFSMKIGVVINWPSFAVPLVVKSHGSYTKMQNETFKKINHFHAKNDQILYERADFISAVSHDTATINKKLFNIKKEIKVLYNGIEKTDIDNSIIRKQNIVIYYGSLMPLKGIHSLMKAWNIVHKELPHVELHIYGKGKIKPLKKILSGSAINSVYFNSHTPRNTLFEKIQEATLAIFPSYSECFSVAPLEAMSLECPVIFTSRSSGKELITDSINGFLIDPDDIHQIADRILLLLKDSKIQQQFSSNGKKTIDNLFTIEEVANQHILYYREILNSFNKNSVI